MVDLIMAITGKIITTIRTGPTISNRDLDLNANFVKAQDTIGTVVQQKTMYAGFVGFQVIGRTLVVRKTMTTVITPVMAPQIITPTIFPIIPITIGIFITVIEWV